MSNEKTNIALAFRFQFAAFMLCGDEYHLIGEGFTTFPEDTGANEYSRRYVNSRTERSDVTGVGSSILYECDAIVDDPVVDSIVEIHENERTGNMAKRSIVTVNCWEEYSPGTYVAYQRIYTVIPQSKGDDDDNLTYSGVMRVASKTVGGIFVKATKKFIPLESYVLQDEVLNNLVDENNYQFVMEES